MDFPLFSDEEAKRHGIKIRRLTKLMFELETKFNLREDKRKETGEDLYWNYFLSAMLPNGGTIQQYAQDFAEAKFYSQDFIRQFGNCSIESFFSKAKRELIQQVINTNHNRYN